MIMIEIPGGGTLALEYLVLDVNGTLAVDGTLISGVAEAIFALKLKIKITLLTADTFGKGKSLAETLGVDIHILQTGHEREQKAAFIQRFGAEKVAAMGQGANDELMLKEAALGICVLSREGTAVSTLLAADVLAENGPAGLQLLLHPTRLIATLRS
jgi:P-type E1-E2 ATPase